LLVRFLNARISFALKLIIVLERRFYGMSAYKGIDPNTPLLLSWFRFDGLALERSLHVDAVAVF